MSTRYCKRCSSEIVLCERCHEDESVAEAWFGRDGHISRFRACIACLRDPNCRASKEEIRRLEENVAGE